MKKLITLLLFVISICFFYSCSTSSKENYLPKKLTVLVDITDPHMVRPMADALLQMYQFEKNKDIEASFRLCVITDKALNQTKDILLEDGAETKKINKRYDAQFREKRILGFYEKVRSAITEFTQFHNADTSLRHSECFKILANEIATLNEKKNSENTVVIFSDIQENSRIFSCYTKANKQLLEHNPEKVIEIFEKTKLLPDDLKDFKFFFVYEPVNREQDFAYELMVKKIYMPLLEKRQAKVFIQTNNQNYSYE